MVRRFSLVLAALALAAPAEAQTLAEAMSQALDTNPGIAARAERLAATREAVPQARADALPSVSASASATASGRETGGVDLGESETWSAGLSVSQLLFAGGRVAGSVRQARARVGQAEAEYDSARQTLLLDVTRAYADVRQARAIVAARETTVSNLEEQRRFTAAQFEAGVITRTDLAQADARLSQARTQLIQARGTLAAAEETFTRLVGAPPSALAEPTGAAGLPPDLGAALAIGLEQAPSLRAAAAAEAAADAGVDVASAGGRPRLSLEAGTDLSGGFESDFEESSSDSVGVRFSWPLVSGGLNASRARESRASRTAARLERVDAERRLRESVTSAWTGLEAARAARISAAEQVRAAEDAYRGVSLERETGLRATVEVLDQEQDLLNARIALAQAERDFVVAERQLLSSLGALTPQ